MPELKLNGKTYSGSTSYASAITYTEEDGSKTTVQDKISEMDSNISEQNKNITDFLVIVVKLSTTITIEANSAKKIPEIDLSKDGYTAIGVVGFAAIEGCSIYNCEVINSVLVSYIYNNNSVPKTDAIRYEVLYVKNL